MTSKKLSLILTIAFLLLAPGSAFATTGGASMPWDQGLNNLIDNLTGTVARLMIIAATVVAGISWALTEHNTGGRKLSQLIFGGGIALAAVQFLAALGFAGALV